MSLETDKNRSDYIGNGAVNQYSYVFKIFNEQNIKVTVRDLNDVETELQIGVDYTVSGVGDEGGGFIVLTDNSQDWIDDNSFLVEDFVLTIRRVVPLTQETDFRNQGSFLPESHEDTFDLSRMIDQQLNEEIGRSVKLPETIPATDFDPSLPSDIQDPDRVFLTNETGDGFRMGPTASDIENAQAYAISAGHSKDTAKDWAIKTDGTVVDSETGVDSGEYSSKEYAQGVQRRGQAGGGSAKDWAQHMAGPVDDSEFSAKYYADQAAQSAIAAAVTVAASNWNDVVYVTAAQSPFTISDTDSGTLFSVDATAGNVVLELPEIASLDLSTTYSLSVLKTDATDNTVTINSTATDTIGNSTDTSDVIEVQNGGRTFIPDTDNAPDEWSKLSYGEGGATGDLILAQDRNIKLLADGDVEHFEVLGAPPQTTLTNVYSQQIGGGAPVTNPIGNQYGGAYFFNAAALTNLRRVRVKLLSASATGGSVTLSLVEADGAGKPIPSTTIATFPAVDATSVAGGNGTNVDLDSPALFDLDANKNYAFIYDHSTVLPSGSGQVVIIGTPSLSVVGGGWINSGDINDPNDWIATTSPANAEDMALTLFEETATTPATPSTFEFRILDKMYINIPGMDNTSNEIAVGNYVMSNGDNAVVTLNRDNNTPTVLPVTILPGTAMLGPDDIVIARKFNDEIYTGFNSDLRLAVGESGSLDQGGAGNIQEQTVEIDKILIGSIEGNGGSTSSTNQVVTNFQNVITKGDISEMLSAQNLTTGLFTVVKEASFTVSASLNSTVSTTGAAVLINGVRVATENGSNNTFDSSASWSGVLNVGDTIGLTVQGSGSNDYRFSINAIGKDVQDVNNLVIEQLQGPAMEAPLYTSTVDLPENLLSGVVGAGGSIVKGDDWIDSVTNGAAGFKTINFKAGIFTEPPVIVAAPTRDSNLGDIDISVASVTTTQALIVTTLAHDANANFNSQFNVYAHKQGADRITEASLTTVGSDVVINKAETIKYTDLTLQTASTATRSLYFSSINNTQGSIANVVANHDAADGSTFTAQASGVYTFNFYSNNLSSLYVGFAKNVPASLLTSGINLATLDDYRVGMGFDSSGGVFTATSSVHLEAGDVIRVMTSSTRATVAAGPLTGLSITFHGNVMSLAGVHETVDVDDKIGIVHEVFSTGQNFDPNSPAGSLTKRLLSTVHRNTTWMSLDIVNNRIALQPGFYKTRISAPGHNIRGHRVYLMKYNNGVLSKVLKSQNAWSDSSTATNRSDMTHAMIDDLLIVTEPTQYEVHHYNESLPASDFQFGSDVNESGEPEIYTIAMFERMGEVTNNVTYNTTVNGNVDPNDEYFHLQDVKPSGTAGGSSIVGQQIRELNTVVTDATWGTLNTDDTFDIDPGIYWYKIKCPAYAVGNNLAILRNVNTGQTFKSPNTFTYTNAPDERTAVLELKVVVTTTTKFHVEQYTQAARATNGLGLPFALDTNIFTEVIIRKLGDI